MIHYDGATAAVSMPDVLTESSRLPLNHDPEPDDPVPDDTDPAHPPDANSDDVIIEKILAKPDDDVTMKDVLLVMATMTKM